MEDTDTILVSGIVPESITDGPDIRFTLFTQGCPHRCRGCHNPQTHSFEGGTEMSAGEVFEKIVKNPLIGGVTFSGGEPFCQSAPLLKLATLCRDAGLGIVIYSGYTFEELLALGETQESVTELLGLCDTLVDGRFEIEERTLNLRFRGSKNQRIIDVPKSLKHNRAVIDESERWNKK